MQFDAHQEGADRMQAFELQQDFVAGQGRQGRRRNGRRAEGKSSDRLAGSPDIGKGWRGFRQSHGLMYTSWADVAVQGKKISLIAPRLARNLREEKIRCIQLSQKGFSGRGRWSNPPGIANSKNTRP